MSKMSMAKLDNLDMGIDDSLKALEEFNSGIGDLHSQLAREARAEYELNVALLEYFEAKGFAQRWQFTTDVYARASDIFDRNQSTDELPFQPQEQYNDE